MSTSANHLDKVDSDNDESGVLCLTLYVTTSHSTESRKMICLLRTDYNWHRMLLLRRMMESSVTTTTGCEGVSTFNT